MDNIALVLELDATDEASAVVDNDADIAAVFPIPGIFIGIVGMLILGNCASLIVLTGLAIDSVGTPA